MIYDTENLIDEISDAVGLTISTVKAGRINCDDPIDLYLIEFTNGKFLIITDQPSWTTHGAFGVNGNDLDYFLKHIII